MTKQDFEIKPAVAFGYSIAAQVGDRRQITVQCFVDEGEGSETINAKIDQAMRVIDRQQAYYDLEAELEGFLKIGSTLRQAIDGLPIAKRNSARQLAELKAKLDEQEEVRKQIHDDGYKEHVSKGARGNYAPKGFRANQMAAADAEIAKTKEALMALPGSDDQHRQELSNSIRHFQDDLKKRRARVNHLHSLLGKEPVTDYAEQEAFDPGAA
jgi:predicted  nucleic acid-binding Zn-ribbon protein